MKAVVFPGQGSQFSGMGAELYQSSAQAKALFEFATEILGFRITDIMFSGSADELKQTNVTQPAVYLHSVILFKTLSPAIVPQMLAGHSLGEFSALAAGGVFSFEDGLKLVSIRAKAMQKACEIAPSTMAAVIGADNELVENICAAVSGMVVPANYNCPGQIVISGAKEAVQEACAKLKEAGIRKTLLLNVSGAFHSPMMEPAREELAEAISKTNFNQPICPVFQNCVALAVTEPEEIRRNLVAQLTAPVLWTQSVLSMVENGATSFTEIGPGAVLTGLGKKIAPGLEFISIG